MKETKKWFLIYQKKNTALPIIKTDLKDNQYNEIKELFNSINIKKSLK
ncbi:YcxB family protein [Flavobacterium sp.]